MNCIRFFACSRLTGCAAVCDRKIAKRIPLLPQELTRHAAVVAFLCGFSVLATAHTAAAAIAGTSGAVVVATPPADITNGAWESNTQIRAFAEQQQLALASDVLADITAAGTSPSTTDANFSPGQIVAGTVVNSYALHFDVVGSLQTQNAKEATGSITFTDDILGLISRSDSLNSTNGVLGLPGVLYPSGTDHGLELNPAGGGTSDVVTLSADRRTVTVDLRNASFPDDLRIVTAVPEPNALVLATIGLGAWRRFAGRRKVVFNRSNICWSTAASTWQDGNFVSRQACLQTEK